MIIRRKKSNLKAIAFLEIVFFILLIIITARLAKLQIIDFKKYQILAEELRTFEEEELPKRGGIFIEEDGKRIPLAVNDFSYTLYAVPAHISDPLKTAKEIAEILEINPNLENKEFKEIYEKISKKNDWYEVIKKDVPIEKVEKIKEKKLVGIDFEKENKRFYPEGRCFSHLLGFFGFKNEKREGRYGIEEYYESFLSGKSGLIKGEKTVGGIIITTAKNFFKRPKNGADLVLTIDRAIQIKSCQILEEAVKKYEAKSGTIIVVEPKTGQILALYNWPDFDPNQYPKFNVEVFNNKAISSIYEPGSVFKVITFAAGLEEGKITPETTYEDKGFVKIGNHIIKNAGNKVYGKRTMREVLEKSINTGAIFVAQKVGIKKFREYVKKFGFEEKTGIDLIGEVKSNVKNLYEDKEIYLATASFGQGIAVTPIQMVMSFAAIANNGKLMKPYIVKKIISEDFSFSNEPVEVRQVISQKTAEILKDLLISAVENGWGKRAKVEGYLVAGKTGTAEIPYVDIKGYSQETTHSFIGFAPAQDPKFVALVKLDSPKAKFSDRTAAPVFGKLAEFILKYLNIPPTETK
jgi:cell division protein FtsI/penicillin-binding protein 2